MRKDLFNEEVVIIISSMIQQIEIAAEKFLYGSRKVDGLEFDAR